MKSYGYYKSEITNSDINVDKIIFNSTEVPKSYELKISGKLLNQGSTPSCVACSLNELYYFYCKQLNKNFDLNYIDIFNNRPNKNLDGMSPKDGFNYLKDRNKIKTFGHIHDLNTLKISIIFNGPALVALPVRSQDSDRFWIGNKNYGGHAVSFVGYNEDGFLLKNSWGYDYGNKGIELFPYSDINTILEIWTILS